MRKDNKMLSRLINGSEHRSPNLGIKVAVCVLCMYTWLYATALVG